MELLKSYALQFVGIPYIWGGATPHSGLDCSGFAQVLLHSVGLDPSGDQTAQELFNYLLQHGSATNQIQLGHWLFFGTSSTHITHIAMALDPYRMIEAGGGGPGCVNASAADSAEAYVKISMITRRSDLVGIIKPDYSKIGVSGVPAVS